MTKRERVLAAILGQDIDSIPSSYSLHFPAEKAKSNKGVRSHLEFYKKTDVDIMKIMNEYLVPDFGGIRVPSDWKIIPSFNRKTKFISDFGDFVKKIVDRLGPDDFFLATIHGICASSIHPIEARYGYLPVRELQVSHLREKSAPYLDACRRIADGLCCMADVLLEAGVDGIYYAALGGERHFYTDEEFSRAVLPFDLQVLRHIKAKGGYVLLHLCKNNLNMQRFKPYAPYADIVNWGVAETNFSLKDGKKLFSNAAIMGGLPNRAKMWSQGSDEDLKKAIKKIIAEMGRKKFIMGADCTLATDLAYERINTAVRTARLR